MFKPNDIIQSLVTDELYIGGKHTRKGKRNMTAGNNISKTCATCQEHLETIDALKERLSICVRMMDMECWNTDYVDRASDKKIRRDMFAAAALTGYYSNPNFFHEDADVCRSSYIEQSLAIADALIAEVDKQ